MSITSQIQGLIQDRDDIREALVSKSVSSATGSGFDDFAEDIISIWSGSLYVDFTQIGYSKADSIACNSLIYKQLQASVQAYQSCSNLPVDSSYYLAGKEIYWFPDIDFSGVEDLSNFAQSGSLVYIDRIILPDAKNTKWMFDNNPNLGHISEISTSNNLWQAADMFRNCSKLKEVPVFNTSQVVDFSGMFWGCTALESVPNLEVATSSIQHPDYVTGSINMDDMFRYCTGLSGSISSTIFSHMQGVKNAGGMFMGCSNITAIQETMDLSSLTLDERPVEDSGLWGGMNMFKGCTNLSYLHLTGLRVNLGQDGLSDCPLATESVEYIVQNLGTPLAGTDTFYVGSSNLAKLSAQTIADAEAKGWTIST